MLVSKSFLHISQLVQKSHSLAFETEICEVHMVSWSGRNSDLHEVKGALHLRHEVLHHLLPDHRVCGGAGRVVVRAGGGLRGELGEGLVL